MRIIERVRPQSKRKALNAEVFCNRYLADGNAALEAGNKELAEKLYAKSQYWLDRYNRLVGNA